MDWTTCANTKRNTESSSKMAYPADLEEASNQHIGHRAYYEVKSGLAENQTMLDLNNMEARVCNLSEILQQPNTSIMAVNPADVFLSSKESPGSVYMINTVLLEDGQMVDGNAIPQNVESTNTNGLEEVELINIMVSNTRELRSKDKNKDSETSMPTFKPIADRVALPRAQAVLPRCLGYRNGVVLPKSYLPEFALFGPVEGIVERLSRTEARHLVCECALKGRTVFLIPNDDESFMHIDVSDQDKSNWIGLLSLGNNETANVWLHLIETKIYAVTTRCLDNTTPLAIGYTRNYAEELGIPFSQPILDLNEELKKERTKWNCKRCNLSMGSIKELERHNNKYHTKNTIRKRRCQYCFRNFKRIFCFRRHVKHCLKNPANEISIDGKSSETDLSTSQVPLNSQKELNTKTLQLNTPQNYEEQRLPSDESLQNYTNILDISTNLFDADRMLDISATASIKSDEYDKMPADFDFSENLFSSSPKKTKKSEVKSMSPVTCSYCKQTVVKSKLRLHSYGCPSRASVCHCGKKFRTRNSFAMHMLRKHRVKAENVPTNISDNEQDTQAITTDVSISVDVPTADPVLPVTDGLVETISHENEDHPKAKYTELINNEYQCQECSQVFKRRGMLVMHLLRSHNLAATALSAPLVVPRRRYPCPSCPKIYTAAQKRKLHVATHHPDVKPEEYRTESIELSREAAAPAKCWACPRQYTTRAKLLQHARAHHPHQKPPSPSPAVPQKKSKSK